MKDIPPAYAYSVIIAAVIGVAVVTAIVMPSQPQPRQQTVQPISAAERQRQEAEAATAKARAEEEMYARIRGGAPESHITTEEWQHFQPQLDRMLRGGQASPELIGRCFDAGHSLAYCNRQ